MPSSARHLPTLYVARRVDLGIDPYGFAFICVLRQHLFRLKLKTEILFRIFRKKITELIDSSFSSGYNRREDGDYYAKAI